MNRYIWKVALVAALIVLPAALGADAPAAEEVARPRIEAVFVLDTTGSMGGLIEGAKQKIWSIANALASGKPTPEIHMGLVAYRDRGDEYVTKLTPLTDDLDALYADLLELRANGGGDAPESVNQALHEAVTKIKWSTDDRTFRVIYLVGDCPPHMDYEDDVKYPETCRRAAAAEIVINTIQCGGQAATTPLWRDIADRAEGAFFQVEQSGGAVAIATPFDKKMAELSAALEWTRIYYGTAAEREEMGRRTRVAAEALGAAAPTAAADRAAFVSGDAAGMALARRKELVTDVVAGKLSLDEIDKAELPDDLKSMTPQQREAFVRERSDRREQLRAEIGKLQAQRRAYIDEKLREAGTEGEVSFDDAILESAKDKAAEKGISYEESEDPPEE